MTHVLAFKRYRLPFGADQERRIEMYPTWQWGLLGDYNGYEDYHSAWGREATRRLAGHAPFYFRPEDVLSLTPDTRLNAPGAGEKK
jgi:hypothetical protein